MDGRVDSLLPYFVCFSVIYFSHCSFNLSPFWLFRSVPSSLPPLCLFLPSSYPLLTLLMPSAPFDGGFPIPFLPHLHRPRYDHTSTKVRLDYKNFTPTRTREWFCKDTKKMPYREIYFSTIRFRERFPRLHFVPSTRSTGPCTVWNQRQFWLVLVCSTAVAGRSLVLRRFLSVTFGDVTTSRQNKRACSALDFRNVPFRGCSVHPPCM